MERFRIQAILGGLVFLRPLPIIRVIQCLLLILGCLHLLVTPIGATSRHHIDTIDGYGSRTEVDEQYGLLKRSPLRAILQTEEETDANLEFDTEKRTYLNCQSNDEDLNAREKLLKEVSSLKSELKALSGKKSEDPEHPDGSNVIQLDPEAKENSFEFPEPHVLGPRITDWDKQREDWLTANPHMRRKPHEKPKVLIVTGSQPKPCRSPIGDHFHIKSFKIKVDYARLHGYEIYYSLSWLDPLLGGEWVKLPNVRKLMLTHPEIEWIFWIDSDAVFTDMLFEAPFDTYTDHNMVMWGWEEGALRQRSWVAFNAGVFMIRNCQWSLDLIDKWSPMGQEGPVRKEYGRILSEFLSNRGKDTPADDQSALLYLILTDESVRSKVKLVDTDEYAISYWWVPVVSTYEESMAKYHPGFGDKRWPWITHFTGCGPCGGNSNPYISTYQQCMDNFTRAYNFADNQVLAYMGLQHESLSSLDLVRTRNETERPVDLVDVSPWEERIALIKRQKERSEERSFSL